MKSTYNFSLYLLIEILQLAHEISSFSEVLYKRGALKNFSKFKDKLKKQSSGAVISKNVLKIFANLQKNIFARTSFLIKLQAGNLKLLKAATGDVQYNKVFLKILQISQESFFNKAAVLRAWNLVKKDSEIGAFQSNLRNF